MEPSIQINNSVQITCTSLSERERRKHENKATRIANKVVNAQESGKKKVICKAVQYNKKVLKMILLDLLPDLTLKIITRLPGILKIVL